LEVAELGVNALRSDGDFVAIIDLQSGADLRDGAGAVRIFEFESGQIRCDEYIESAQRMCLSERLHAAPLMGQES
jgi:hypothetical protein